MTLFALNLFDLADNGLYKEYSRRSVAAVKKHGGKVVSLGKLAGDAGESETRPRKVMILVEWPNRKSFDAFLEDPEHKDLHPLREGGTENYLWWMYESLEDLRPVFREQKADGQP